MNGKSDDNAILHEFICYCIATFLNRTHAANADDKFRAEVEDRLTNEYHNTSHTPVSIDVFSLLDGVPHMQLSNPAALPFLSLHYASLRKVKLRD